jgi:lipoate-protein ligase B
LELGRVEYSQAWDFQRRLAAARADGRIPDTLVLLEHPHTYTLGRSGKTEHLLMHSAERAARGISVFEVDRGGDITYHGPGQLIGYPIMHLGRPATDDRLPAVDYMAYLRKVEEVLIGSLAGWSIQARRSPGYTGVWVDDEHPFKVAAIGVKVDAKGISQHGFALNVHPDLSFFDGIVPCGIRNRGVTSMERLLHQTVSLEQVTPVVAERFAQLFGLKWRRIGLSEIGPLLDSRILTPLPPGLTDCREDV